jgi:P-type Cu2+ transporter
MHECDLCGLDCGKYSLEHHVGGSDRFFCCMGCMNVYLILWENGTIQAGQNIRDTELFRRSLQLGLISNRTAEELSVSNTFTASQELLLHVHGMWCTSCAWLIEHALRSLPGVVLAEASFATDLVTVRYRPQDLPPDKIIERIAALGYRAERYAIDSESSDAEWRDLLIRTGLAAFLWANVMSLSLVLYAGYFEQISPSVRRGLPFVLMALATPVVFYCAQPVLQLAWRGVLNGSIRMEVLLSIGILAAYGYSVAQAFRGEIHLYFDTATVIVTLVLTGKLIERGAKERVTQWITSLHRMMPNKARLLVRGEERFVSAEALETGQVFLVKAGEHIPADGLVVEGESHADESLLTGEPTPIAKHRGEAVVAGSINVNGVLRVKATRCARDSTLSRVIQQVEQALGSRCNLERTVDRISRVFVPCIVVVAVLTFFFVWLVGATLGQALMRGITVLVIACPCALGLATPLTITAAFGAACRRGILVRDSRVLESVGKVDTVIFDKTGTVTEGKFTLLDLVCSTQMQERTVVAAARERAGSKGDISLHSGPRNEKGEILALFASLEQYSEHPLGQAVTKFALARGCALHEASAIEIHKGRGITGIVRGKSIFAGNRALLAELGIQVEPELELSTSRFESEGRTVAFLGWDGALQAFAILGDRVKPDAINLLAELKMRGVDVRLVSGDALATTRWTASTIGVDSFESGVVPEQKADVVRRLQEHGAVVAMVGDGINDAPALAQADLGIAIGSGTDIAMRAAAVILMNGSILKVADIFDLASRTMRVVRQNLFWAFFYNSVGISLAVTGILNPIMAAVAMLLSSASVVGNSLRLARRVS